MRQAFLLLLLATSVSAAVPRFAAPGLRVTNLKASLAQDFTDHLAQQLVRRGLSVITNTDVQMVLGIERQKQLLGCSDDGSTCMTELAGALGADGVVMGTVVRVGKKFQVNVRIVGARDAKPLALYSEQCEREEDLFGVLDLAAQSLVSDLQPYLAARAKQDKTSSETSTKPTEPIAPLVRTGPGPRRLWWIPAVTAGVFGLASAGFFAGAAATQGELSSASGVPREYPLNATVARGQTFQALGWAGAALAGASLVALAGMLLFADDEVVITLAPRLDAVGFAVGGAW